MGVLRDAQEIRGQTGNSLKRAVVGELQFQPEIGCAEHLDNFLKQVAALGADAHEITLDRSLDFDLAVLDLLHYLSTLFDRYTGLNRNLLPRGSAGGRSNGAIRKVFERNLALGELLLKNIDDSLNFEIIDALNDEFLVLVVQFDLRLRVLQIKPRLNLLSGLLSGIQHLGHVNNGDNVKAIVGHEDSIHSPPRRGGVAAPSQARRRRGGQTGAEFLQADHPGAPACG